MSREALSPIQLGCGGGSLELRFSLSLSLSLSLSPPLEFIASAGVSIFLIEPSDATAKFVSLIDISTSAINRFVMSPRALSFICTANRMVNLITSITRARGHGYVGAHAYGGDWWGREG